MKIKQVGTPLPEGSALWRYFDFQKFLSFMIEECVFFNRMDKMEDMNEGISINQLQLKFGTEREKLIAKLEKANSNKKELPLERRQRLYFLSCWLIHHRESVAMWNSYSDDSGIALKVDAKKLIDSIVKESKVLNDSEKLLHLYYGNVHYKDFFNKKDRSSFKNEEKILGFHKDTCYEHEHEYRFLIKQDIKAKGEVQFVKLKLNNFKQIPFTLIYHPKMEPWKKDNIRRVIESFAIININCKDSELQLKNW